MAAAVKTVMEAGSGVRAQVLTITAPSSADFSTSFFYDPRGPCNADCTACGPMGDCQVRGSTPCRCLIMASCSETCIASVDS